MSIKRKKKERSFCCKKLDYDIVCVQIFKTTAKEFRKGKKFMPQKVLESPLFCSFCESFGADPYLVAEGIKKRAMDGCRIINLNETIRILG